MFPSNSSSTYSPSLWWLRWSLALGYVEKYAHVLRALAPSASTSTSSKIVSTMQAPHPLVSLSPCPHSLMDFQSNGNLELPLDYFRSAFLHMSHLSLRRHFSMVFEHLWDAFDLEDSTNGFIQLHQLNSYVAMGHFPRPNTCILNVIKLLTLAKPLSNMSIVTNLPSCSLILSNIFFVVI